MAPTPLSVSVSAASVARSAETVNRMFASGSEGAGPGAKSLMACAPEGALAWGASNSWRPPAQHPAVVHLRN